MFSLSPWDSGAEKSVKDADAQQVIDTLIIDNSHI